MLRVDPEVILVIIVTSITSNKVSVLAAAIYSLTYSIDLSP